MNQWDAFVKLVESPLARKHPLIAVLLAAVVFVGVPVSTVATFVIVGNRVSHAAEKSTPVAIPACVERQCAR